MPKKKRLKKRNPGGRSTTNVAARAGGSGKFSSLSPELARKIYTALVRCRKFEEKIVEVYGEKEMRCPTHLSLGQEGAAAGVSVNLRKDDLVFSTHRCHSHTIAKGGDFKLMFAELYGKEAGCSKGKGGSMHFVQPDIGLMGASAIVGGSVPLAVGAALAAKMQGKDIVSVAYFGDGGIEQGAFHESMNFASLKKLPVIFVCENNFLATCTWLSVRQPYQDLYRRAAGYGVPGVQVDGTKVLEVYEAARQAVEHARSGKGPFMIEAICCRWKEHVGPNEDTHLGFRTKEDLEEWKKKDPVKLFEKLLIEKNIVIKEDLEKISNDVQSQINEAVAFSKQAPFPKPEALYENV